MNTIRSSTTLLIIFLFLFVGLVTATPHEDAKTTADLIQKAITSANLPYERELTVSNMQALGINTSNLHRPYGTYTIRIKSASYNSSTGFLTLNLYAWHNGTALKTHSPWHWYMPFLIDGSNNNQRLNSFAQLVVYNIDLLPFGTPIGDDLITYYGEYSGRLNYDPAGDQTYATLTAGTSSTVDSASTSLYAPTIVARTTEPYFDMLGRFFFTFNTSALDDSVTIDSAIVGIYQHGAPSGGLGTPNATLIGATPVNNISYVSADFDNIAKGTLFSDTIAYSAISSGSYANFTLTSSGRNNINKAGTCVFALVDTWDVASTFGGTWASGANSRLNIRTVAYSPNTTDPFIQITYSAGCSAPVSAFSANVTSGYPPLIVGYTDSTTNTPTSWNWTFGDGGTSTSQNPVYTYDNVIGASITQYTVNMTASNACGNDDELKSNYITLYPLNGSFSANVTSGCTPLTVGFTDLTGNGTPSSWSWDFGGDGTSAIQSPSHTFSTPGTYWISLNASNTYSYGIRNWTGLITVSAGGPTAAFSANDTTPCTDQPVLFTDASTSSPSNWSWDFNNDGTPDSFLQNPTNTFSVAGLYTVNLTVSNTCGSDSEVKSNYINSSVCTPTPTPTPTPTATVTTITTIDVNWSYMGNFTGRALGESWPVLLTFFGDMIWLLAWIFFIFLMFLAFLKISGR